jgi:ADP-L-glycero-D-manno-heptose 6-epimerase
MSAKPVYVVTGGVGFIGSNVVAALDARGEDIVDIDNLGTGDKWRNIARCRLAGLVAPSDAFSALAGLGAQVAGVVHMGAISSTTEEDIDLIVETNFRLSCRLWDWCTRGNIPLIYASSAATYGNGSRGFDDRDDAEHLASLRPLNAYGWSKNLFDRWVCERVSRGLSPSRWAGLKFFNVFGPNEMHKAGQRSVAVQVYEQVQRGERVKLFASDNPDYPDGGQMRDFVWVGDCVDIILWLLDGPRKSGIYNAGSGKARTFRELAEAVYAALDISPAVEYVPMPSAIKGRYQYFTEAKMSKLAAAGYTKALTPLEEGVRRYVVDHLQRSG